MKRGTVKAAEKGQTVPFVLPPEMVRLIRNVAAARNARGERVGRRAYSMSAVVRDALTKHTRAWASEVQKPVRVGEGNHA